MYLRYFFSSIHHLYHQFSHLPSLSTNFPTSHLYQQIFPPPIFIKKFSHLPSLSTIFPTSHLYQQFSPPPIFITNFPTSHLYHQLLSMHRYCRLRVYLLIRSSVRGGEGEPLRFVQGVGPFVLLAHPVHHEHHQQDGAQQADYGAPYEGWGGGGGGGGGGGVRYNN